MAPKSASRVGGEFLDLRELAADGPVLALFRIVSYLDREPDKFKRYTYPVVADVLICDGPRRGEQHLGETFKFAPANALRGITAKASEAGERPVNDVGDEIMGRVVIVDKPGGQPFVGIDPVSPTEGAAIMAVYEQAGGDGWGRTGAPASNGAASNGAAQPATAGAASAPWR